MSEIIGMLSFILMMILILAPFALSIIGIFLAFSANILLGVASLFIPGVGLVFGIFFLFGKKDTAIKAAQSLGLKV